jgi:hypothetical protein
MAIANPIVIETQVLVYYSVLHNHAPGAFFSQSWGHSSIQSEKQSLSESVSPSSPPPHEPGTDLLE